MSGQARRTATGPRILAFGHYQPERVVTNEELAARVDTSDEWIRSRVGIARRHIAAPQETVTDMAVHAGAKALAASGLPSDEIDLVVVATCTQETQIPVAAPGVAHRLGIEAPGAYDINAGCAGFAYALTGAADTLRAGSARNALVIGSDKMSAWVDPSDRSTCVIFADAAGAAVLAGRGPQDGWIGRGPQDGWIGPVAWGSSGGNADKITVKHRHSYFAQDGQAVYRWATSLAPVALEACRRAGVAPSELAAFVPHQANTRIIDGIVKRLGLGPDVVIAKDLVESGNTSAASVPLALSKLIERREVPSGAPVLLFGFGGGLTYAGQVIRCP
jgi:3-oxoacyl-[acyl-carrier-protein] synthase III